MLSARAAGYWLHAIGTPRRAKAFCWIGVGLVVMLKGFSGARAMTTLLRARVMRSEIRDWKLWTGSLSSVWLLVAWRLRTGVACEPVTEELLIET